MSTKSISFATLLCLALSTQVYAEPTPLYDNGPSTYDYDGLTINFGYQVTNSFALAAQSSLTGASFINWLTPGDVASKVDWSINTTSALDGTTRVAWGTATLTSSLVLELNQYNFAIYKQSFSLPNVVMGAGTYWLQLNNEVVNSVNLALWDQNNGSSLEYSTDDATGNFGSESFQITGVTPVPEPASFALFAAGVGVLVLRFRRT